MGKTLKGNVGSKLVKGQGTLFNFLVKSPSIKRNVSISQECASPPAKKARGGDEAIVPVNGELSAVVEIHAAVTSSPEQANRIEENRIAAKIKLHAKKLAALSDPNIGVSWYKALQDEFSKPYFAKLSTFVEEERSRYTIYPPVQQVYTWTRMTEIQEVKVVILGQDPYHNPGQAHGLCFSVPKGVAAPPSLINIYKELANDIDGFTVPSHGNLTSWAKQGVLLLNACLTVRKNSPNSHKDKGWENVTDAVIRWINTNRRGVVFLLWGSYAQKKGQFIDKSKHLVLTAVHPSPLSVHRGFYGCAHFSKTNDYLKKQNKTPIDWCRLRVDDWVE